MSLCLFLWMGWYKCFCPVSVWVHVQKRRLFRWRRETSRQDPGDPTPGTQRHSPRRRYSTAAASLISGHEVKSSVLSRQKQREYFWLTFIPSVFLPGGHVTAGNLRDTSSFGYVSFVIGYCPNVFLKIVGVWLGIVPLFSGSNISGKN